jgi:hypothetical protein
MSRQFIKLDDDCFVPLTCPVFHRAFLFDRDNTLHPRLMVSLAVLFFDVLIKRCVKLTFGLEPLTIKISKICRSRVQLPDCLVEAAKSAKALGFLSNGPPAC